MKKICAIMLMLLLAHGAAALKVDRLNVQISVDDQGFASVTENYTLGFISDFEFSDFKLEAKKNASSLNAWESDYNFFGTHFAGPTGNTITSSAITFDETSRALTLGYGLEKKFARLQSSEQRSDTYTIQDTQLAAFNVAGTIVIPENTTITINLPVNSQVDASGLPDKVQVINGNQVLLNGIQSNSINVQYSVSKSIAPSGIEIINGISNIYIFAPVIALLIIGIFAKREEIEKRIEDYLVDHSEIKPRESEEIELDVGK